MGTDRSRVFDFGIMQEAVGTSFEVSHEKQHVRLLELPPDLLQLLTSEEPPL